MLISGGTVTVEAFPFLRDCLTYFLLIAVTYFSMTDRDFSTADAAMYIVIYAFYVGLVIRGRQWLEPLIPGIQGWGHDELAKKKHKDDDDTGLEGNDDVELMEVGGGGRSSREAAAAAAAVVGVGSGGGGKKSPRDLSPTPVRTQQHGKVKDEKFEGEGVAVGRCRLNTSA